MQPVPQPSDPPAEEPEENTETLAETIGSRSAEPALKKASLWLTLAVPVVACGFGGSKEPWALGATASLVALNLFLIRPSVRPPRTVIWTLALAGLFMLAAFLPLKMELWPDWRLHFAEDFDVPLPERNSPQPWISFEAWVLAMVGFAWLWSCFGRGFDVAERRWLMRRLVMMTALLALLAIIVRYNDWIVPFWRTEWLSGYFGPFPDRNNFSGFLAMGAVLAFATAYDAWRRRSVFWLIVVLCVVCIVWALVSNTSRAGVVLFFAGVVAWMFFASFSRRSAQRIGVSASVVLVFAAVFILFGKPILDRMHASGGVAQVISEDNRVHIAASTLRMIAQSPWFGVGLGNFDPAFAFVVTDTDPYSRFVHPENDWLWLAADCGVLVLALFLIALAAWFWHTGSWSRGKETRSGQRDRRLRNACAIAVFMIVVHGLVDVPGHSLGVPFTMILVASLALRPRRLVPIPYAKLSTVLWRFGAAIFCVFAAIMWFSVSMGNPLIPGKSEARRQIRKAEWLASHGDLQASREAFDRAIQIRPLQWNYYYQRAIVELALGWPPQAVLQEFARMRYLEPHSALVCMNEAQLWVKYHPPYALPALREAMKRLKVRSQEFYNTILAGVAGNPELRREMFDLATDPKYKLVYLYSVSGAEFNECLEKLLEQDPRLETLTPEERLAMFKLWYQRGDRARLIRMLGEEKSWRTDGWPVLADDLASKGDYRGAWQLAMDAVHPPAYKPISRGGDTAQLSRNFTMHPTDSSYGLELYEIQKTKGLWDDALMTLGKLSQLPEAPKRLIYEESVILARKGDYVRAWEKMNQYIQSSR